MVLTPEQKERMRLNRERALQLQKQGKEKRRQEENEERELKRRKKDEEEEEETLEIEAFEEGASEFVTTKEAKLIYCLPEGTLAVCKFVEKENPHHKGWAPMKMYYRSEMQRRSRKRFGGLQGLVAERRKREEKRFAKDIEKAKEIFQK